MLDDPAAPSATDAVPVDGLSSAWRAVVPPHGPRSRRPAGRGVERVNWRRAVILAVVLACHVVALFALSRGMRPRLATPTTDSVIEVRLIDTPPPVPVPPPAPAAPRVPAVTVTAPAAAPPPQAAPKPMPSIPTREPVRASATAALYDKQGDIILPAGAASAPAPRVPEYRSALGVGDARVLNPKNPVRYKPTRFEKDWVPANETALDSLVRKTTVAHDVLKLPGGHHLKCVISPLMLVGGCGITGQHQLAAPVKVKDRIDNLAPATPLLPSRPKPAPADSAATPARPGTVATPQSPPA